VALLYSKEELAEEAQRGQTAGRELESRCCPRSIPRQTITTPSPSSRASIRMLWLLVQALRTLPTDT
jgi:hypothetical protein